MTEETIKKILALPLEERLEIAQRLWESLAPSAMADSPLPPSERKLLESRMDAYDADPSSASSWSDVRERVSASLADTRRR